MRLNKNTFPQYIDGCLELYRIVQTNSYNYVEKIVSMNETIWFEIRGITDRLRNELKSSNTNPEKKIRIPQNRKIDTMCVVKIENKYFRVYNAYHFTNKDGFEQSDLTLTKYDVYEEGE